MLKPKLKAALGRLSLQLPWGGRRAVFEALVDHYGCFQVFKELGGRLHVDSICVKGANGVFWGSMSDSLLLGAYATSGEWSAQLVDLFRRFFQEHGGGTFLDIGANIGLTVVPITQDPRVSCFGFEPEPRNFAFLQRNVETNCQQGNVVLKQMALFDRQAQLQFEISPINSGDNRIRVSSQKGVLEEETRETISVSAERLDDVLRRDNLRLPIAVKMDTQGAEPAIFAGGANVLSAAELIAFEYWPYAMRRAGGDVYGQLQLVGEHFKEGCILPGDEEMPMEWRPIGSVVDELKRHVEDPNIGTRYFDVFVRK